MKTFVNTLACLALGGLTSAALAQEPSLQTPSPVIFLNDNLGEPDRLGWCIDTLGRDFGEQLHAHSCKPQGGDVQFAYSADDRQIASVEFDGKCMVRSPAGSEVTFGLVDCDDGDPAQHFDFDQALGRFSPSSSADLCIAVGETIRQAGPFSSRDLILADCATTAAARITWTFQETEDG